MGRSGHSDVDDAKASLVSHALTAAGAGAAAIWSASQISFPTTFDYESPDFDPIFLLPAFFGAVALWQAALAARDWSRMRRFGAATLELKGAGPWRPGRRLEGRIRTQKPVAAQGPWRVALQCVETHAFRDMSESASRPTRDHAFVVWEETVEHPAEAADPQAGIPFAFTIPTTLGPPPDPDAGPRENPYFRFKAAVFIPGMRRVWSHGSPAKSRSWRIVATAPTRGPDFNAAFAAPIEG